VAQYSDKDPYADPRTGVLHNKLGITDARALDQAERDITQMRLVELNRNPIKGRFDLPHLQAVHHHIFQDVYSWAGQLRTVDVQKKDTYFAHHGYIESEANKLFGKLAKEDHLKGMFREQFVERAAHYLNDTNALHPFREGNGRALRAYFEQLGREAGRPLDFSRASSERTMESFERSFFQGSQHLRPYIEDALRAADRQQGQGR
jgi:cell filamentation protein